MFDNQKLYTFRNCFIQVMEWKRRQQKFCQWCKKERGGKENEKENKNITVASREQKAEQSGEMEIKRREQKKVRVNNGKLIIFPGSRENCVTSMKLNIGEESWRSNLHNFQDVAGYIESSHF